MNRLQFIGQTHQGKKMSIDDIINFFDQTMTAYDLVGELTDVNVNGTMDKMNSSLNLIVESPHIDELEGAVSYINDTLHNCSNNYDKTFEVRANVNGSHVELFVRESIIY